MPIYKAVATGNRNNELYRETARSNWKKPSIATMPDYSRNTVFILTPLIFRCHLPLSASRTLICKPFKEPRSITSLAESITGILKRLQIRALGSEDIREFLQRTTRSQSQSQEVLSKQSLINGEK